MPYIPRAKRDDVDPYSYSRDTQRDPENAGELNYVITRICLNYLKTTQTNYQRMNDVVGVLECLKLEFYRRKVSFYEDQKHAENGDVYGSGLFGMRDD